jgi:hypothetical protein
MFQDNLSVPFSRVKNLKESLLPQMVVGAAVERDIP